MRRLACSFLVSAATVTGCAVFSGDVVDRQTYTELQSDWITAQGVVLAANAGGLVADIDMANVWIPLFDAGNAALDQLDAATLAGDADAAEAARAAYQSAMRAVIDRMSSEGLRDGPA